MNYEERESLRGRSVSFQMSIPLTLIEVVDRFADSKSLSTAAAMAHLIRVGLRAEAAAKKEN